MRTVRSVKNFLSGFTTTAVTLALSIFATPYLLKWLGNDQFGAYRLLMDYTGYLFLLEFGLGDSLIPLVAHALAIKSPKQTRQVLVTGIRAFICVVPLKLLAGLALIFFADRLIQTPPELLRVIRISCAVSVLTTLLCIFAPFRTLLEAQKMGFRINQLLTVQSLLTTILSIILVRKGMGLVGMFIALAVGILPYFAVITIHGLRELPGLSRSVISDPLDHEKWKKLWHLNFYNFAANMFSRFGRFSDNIIIGLLINPHTVTRFFITQRPIEIAGSQLFNLGISTWASLGELHHQNKTHLFKERLKELTQLTTITGMAIMGPLVAYNHHFVSLWVGPYQYAGNWVTLVSAANVITLALIALWGWIFSASGQVAVLLPQYGISTLINLIFSLALTRTFGMRGPPLGTLIANITVGLWAVPFLLQKHFKVKMIEIYFSMLKPFFVLLPVTSLIWIYAHSHTPRGWIGLFGEAGLALVVIMGTAWFLALSRKDRALWIHRFEFHILKKREKYDSSQS